MRYISTRGQAPALNFEAVTLAGLASDGGLYVPESWPQIGADEIAAMATQPYVDVAVTVMRPFVAGALDDEALRDLCAKAYGSFASDAVTPLVQLDPQHWLLELFHGPTLAFKDVALQLLGLLFERFLSNRDTHLTVVGATSGDTGSAAIEALAGKAKVDVFMLHPAGRVSEVQRRQMTTVLADNIHNIAIEGSFDDAQAMVKALFADQAFAGRYAVSAVNSINWARLMAQIVYYFYAASRLGAPWRSVAFAVPTGNFGDVFAGYAASKMGLPVDRLVVATNTNDILHRALSAGDYSVGSVTPTDAPSMDIQVSSNFERLLFDLHGRDGVALAKAMQGFEADKTLTLSQSMRGDAASLFVSKAIDAKTMAAGMKWAAKRADEIIDPHTAIGLMAGYQLIEKGGAPCVTLATAHPAKFPDAVEAATGIRPTLPARLADLFDKEERYVTLPATLRDVSNYIAQRATPKP
ncbi:threonine synthase [Sphingomonas sp. ID0503]|uniref:threonine synthase n=1 Tax=Sphingomonas sp. ID0503 TaxID=3399691 RepID=UPI003AFA9FBE